MLNWLSDTARLCSSRAPIVSISSHQWIIATSPSGTHLDSYHILAWKAQETLWNWNDIRDFVAFDVNRERMLVMGLSSLWFIVYESAEKKTDGVLLQRVISLPSSECKFRPIIQNRLVHILPPWSGWLHLPYIKYVYKVIYCAAYNRLTPGLNWHTI